MTNNSLSNIFIGFTTKHRIGLVCFSHRGLTCRVPYSWNEPVKLSAKFRQFTSRKNYKRQKR